MEPALLKCLRLLRNSGEPLSESEIATRIGEETNYVVESLAKLAEKQVLVRSGQRYFYLKSDVNEKFYLTLLNVFDKIDAKSRAEDFVICLLSAAEEQKCLLSQKTIIRVLTEQGIDSNHVNAFIERLLERNHIGKLKAVMKIPQDEPLPPSIPWYTTLWLVTPTTQSECLSQKESWLRDSYFVREDNYLFAKFTEQVVVLTKARLGDKVSNVTAKILEESYEWWYGNRSARWWWNTDSVCLYWQVKNDAWPIAVPQQSVSMNLLQ